MKNRSGRELEEAEERLVDVYERLKLVLAKHGEELPPFMLCNARKALAALWQIANGLDTDPGHPYELGV